MRPTTNRQGFLRAPLNDILGSESRVRIVRALALAREPLSRRELQRRTELHAGSLPPTLNKLDEAGVIESVGVGRERPYRLRTAFGLHGKLVELFRAEADHSRVVLDRLREMVWQLNPAPDAAWIEGPIADATDKPNDSITIGILVENENPPWMMNVRSLLNGIQRANDVQVEIRLRVRSDLGTPSARELSLLRSAVPLLGLAPLELISPSSVTHKVLGARKVRSQGDHDDMGLAIGRATAEALRADPEIQIRAREYVEQQLATRSSEVRLELEEWRDILSFYSLARLRALLVATSERAIRLRQSMPFAAVLSESERERVRARAQSFS